MNKITILFIAIGIVAELNGSTVEGSLFNIQSEAIQIDKILISPNEIFSKKEPPLRINAITYLCNSGNVQALIREGNVARSDPSRLDSEMLCEFEASSELYRYTCVICVDGEIITIGVLMQQMEYQNSIKNSNSIYISLRGKTNYDLIKTLRLLSDQCKINFNTNESGIALSGLGFNTVIDRVEKALSGR